MGLFDRKKSEYNESQSLYTLGSSQTVLVVGLGNIGNEYAHNRHNVGFMVLDHYHNSHDFTDWMEKKDLRCYLATGMVGSTRVILMKPTTMMNLSGEAVQAVQRFYKITDTETLVVYDELDIDFGTIRTRSGGGSGGHNGIKSLLQHTGENFGRIRVGIGPKTHEKMDSADFVLQDFDSAQSPKLKSIIKEACNIIDEYTATMTLNVETRTVI